MKSPATGGAPARTLTTARHSAASTILLAAVWGGLFLMGPASTAQALDFPGPRPGKARPSVHAGILSLSNRVISASWTVAEGRVKPASLVDFLSGRSLDLRSDELFRLTKADGLGFPASEFELVDPPRLEALPAEPGSATLSRRFPGQQIRLRLRSPDGQIEVEWRAILRDEANAIRQEFRFAAAKNPIEIRELTLVETAAPEARASGSVSGSPVRIGSFFAAYEHPDSRITRSLSTTISLAGEIVLRPGTPLVHSAVWGVVPDGQLRRGFLYYIERERAHPCRPFLHYNSWYDLGWDNAKIREDDCLRVVHDYGQELIQRRGLPLASFVWDDGWDDPTTLWRPSRENLPAGFDRILSRARAYHSTLGFWLSPFGGYGAAKQERLTMGQREGFEPNLDGFSLAKPRYYDRFLETCLNFIDHSGANFFKFDGLSRRLEETEAMLRLTQALRQRKSDVFISITTGTWPSPFWLWYGDSTWRGGNDMGFYGPGSNRERWITYRDLDTYQRIVQAAPLYPLNSLMTQGFAQSRSGSAADLGHSAEEIRRELRSFFASGTCLQELYVSPACMTPENWDDLAETARWAKANAAILVDTHWLGGDPGAGEIYGWASWSPRKSILALRNPAPHPASLSIDLAQALELPAQAPQVYRLKSPWKNEAATPARLLRAGEPSEFQLQPYEVLVWEAYPQTGRTPSPRGS